MKACSLTAHVRKPDGSIVESKLFKDLLHYTPNRSTAKEHYKIATNSTFLERVKSKLDFDENGEVTFKSYKDVMGLEEDTDLLNKLNKDVDSGVYTYEEAISKLQFFNRNNPYNKEYMATLTPNKDKYTLSVVKRTPSKENSLENIIHKQSLQSRILYYLNKAGASVQFIKEGGLEGGRYSTINAEKTADGLYALIQIANGDNTTDILAEEAGHFAIGALGDSPLVERLLNLLDTQVQKQILGEDYENKTLGGDPRREVAGFLVGKALQEDLDNKTPWQKLTHRIAYLAKKIFAKLSGNEVKAVMLEAQKISRQIADGFMSPDFNGDVQNALQTQETLYSASISVNVKAYRTVIQRLKKLSDELETITYGKLHSLIQDVRKDVETGRGLLTNPGVFSDTMALEGIGTALIGILDIMEEGGTLTRLLDEVQFDDIHEFKNHIPEYGKNLRQVRTFLQNSQLLAQILLEFKTSNNLENIVLAKNGKRISVILDDILHNLVTQNSNLQSVLLAKEKEYYARALEDMYGKKYISKSAKIVLKKINSSWRFVNEEASIEQMDNFIRDSLTSLETDITLFERYLASMSNSSDIISQIIDKATKHANKVADDLTNQTLDELKLLKAELKELGYKNTSFLFETDEEGHLTGNILSPKNWGMWEKDRAEFFKTEKEAFKKVTPIDSLSEIELALRWDLWMRPKYKQWNKDHSSYNLASNKWEPNDDYSNPKFNEILPEHSDIRKWYYKYLELKRKLDSALPEGSTLAVRMPQFKGTFINQMENRRLYEGRTKSLKHTLRSTLLELFCESSEDQDYGSLQTYNSKDEELYYNAIATEKEQINRLPLFGINKLKDMSELSTDLFHTTLSYASMAYSYAAMNTLIDVLEVGSSVLKRRSVGKVSTEEEQKGEKSRAYTRYLKYLDKQIYGISMKRHVGLKGIVWEKVVNFTNKIASILFLGGNVTGGLTNLGTGCIEIFKEAATGEFFTLKDLTKANKRYWSMFGKDFGHIKTLGEVNSDDKMSLFIRHFDMRSDNRRNFKAWETRHSWMYNFIDSLLFLPYKTGDHYMQTISYLMAGENTKLYDEEGNEISMLDAYEVVNNIERNEYGEVITDGLKAGKTLKLKEGLSFISKEGKETYNMLSSIINKLSSPFPRPLNPEEQKYLDDNDYKGNPKNIVSELKNVRNDLLWSDDINSTSESDFMNKVREINNRLHGIYDKQNGVAFSQNWYGNAFLSMKGWALGMMERRFGSNHYSVVLGKDVEGSLNTLFKVWAKSVSSKEYFYNALRASILPFGKKAAQEFQRLGWSDNQWKNMKRNFFDSLFMTLLALIRSLSAMPTGEDDDEDDEYWKYLYGDDWKTYKEMYTEDEDVTLSLIHYFSNRLYREQSALNWPGGWYYETTTLLDVIPPGVAAIKDLSSLIFYKTPGALLGDKEDSDFFYQSTVEDKYEEGDSKAKIHVLRYIPYYKSIYTFQHPYEATKSYEYGRNVKNR